MLRFIRLSLVAATTTALVACGGGAKMGGGKDGAAKAAFQASGPAGQGAKSGQSLIRQMAAAAASGSIELSANCAKSGSVKLSLDLKPTDIQLGGIKYKADYNSCSQDGINTYDGSVEVEVKLPDASLQMSVRLKGNLDISGDISDSIDADVTETFAFAATSATSGTVSITANGSIKTSNGSYTYANEAINITADGGLPAASGNP